VALLLLAQLALVQTVRLNAQRVAAIAAFVLAVACGVLLLSDAPVLWATLACASIGAMTGFVLMDMLLGHAYLTAAKMTIAPFRQLHLTLAAVLALRILIGAVALGAQVMHPLEQFWNRFGLYLCTRWFVGLIVPAVFVYMAYDCIRRRSTQSATGILYVTAVLIFIGELMALYLTRETGLPF
jgi:hypothetical protein